MAASRSGGLRKHCSGAAEDTRLSRGTGIRALEMDPFQLRIIDFPEPDSSLSGLKLKGLTQSQERKGIWSWPDLTNSSSLGLS